MGLTILLEWLNADKVLKDDFKIDLMDQIYKTADEIKGVLEMDKDKLKFDDVK